MLMGYRNGAAVRHGAVVIVSAGPPYGSMHCLHWRPLQGAFRHCAFHAASRPLCTSQLPPSITMLHLATLQPALSAS